MSTAGAEVNLMTRSSSTSKRSGFNLPSLELEFARAFRRPAEPSVRHPLIRSGMREDQLVCAYADENALCVKFNRRFKQEPQERESIADE